MVDMSRLTKKSQEAKPQNTQKVCHFGSKTTTTPGVFKIRVPMPISFSNIKFGRRVYHEQTHKKADPKIYKKPPVNKNNSSERVYKNSSPLGQMKFGRHCHHEETNKKVSGAHAVKVAGSPPFWFEMAIQRQTLTRVSEKSACEAHSAGRDVYQE